MDWFEWIKLFQGTASFHWYAEKVRTIFFDLSYIGKSGHADIIERLGQKLQIQDWISWNDGRRAAWNTGQSTSLVFGYVPGPRPIKTPTHFQPTNIRSPATFPNHHRCGKIIQKDVI
jgi:hypothetical protein